MPSCLLRVPCDRGLYTESLYGRTDDGWNRPSGSETESIPDLGSGPLLSPLPSPTALVREEWVVSDRTATSPGTHVSRPVVRDTSTRNPTVTSGTTRSRGWTKGALPCTYSLFSGTDYFNQRLIILVGLTS